MGRETESDFPHFWTGTAVSISLWDEEEAEDYQDDFEDDDDEEGAFCCPV